MLRTKGFSSVPEVYYWEMKWHSLRDSPVINELKFNGAKPFDTGRFLCWSLKSRLPWMQLFYIVYVGIYDISNDTCWVGLCARQKLDRHAFVLFARRKTFWISATPKLITALGSRAILFVSVRYNKSFFRLLAVLCVTINLCGHNKKGFGI